MVARGFFEEPGKDFFQSYIPTPRAASTRQLVGVAVKDDMSLHHHGVTQAFVQADRDVGLTFSSKGSDRFLAFADASFADKNDDRRPPSGSVIFFAGGTISWFSWTQR